MNKNIIKTIAFLLIFSIILYFAIKILWLPPTAISYFYDEPKNSLDIVYIGSSNAYSHFNTVLAYDLYGYTTGLLSTDTQPFSLVKYLIKESEKYQNPSLYVIDIAKAASTLDSFTGEEVRKTIDSMKFSKNRIDAINKTLSYKKDISKDEYINYYFSFLMYHNRYKSIYGNLFKHKDLYKGYLFQESTSKSEPQDIYIWNNEVMELSEESKTILQDLIDYIKSEELPVLFVLPVRTYKEETNKKLNQIIDIIENNKLDVINFNTLEEFNNIDFSTDFYNYAHLNVYGATKYTLYFAQYLKENYKLEDHRNNKSYNSWNKEYERFKSDYKKITSQDFEKLLLKYST